MLLLLLPFKRQVLQKQRTLLPALQQNVVFAADQVPVMRLLTFPLLVPKLPFLLLVMHQKELGRIGKTHLEHFIRGKRIRHYELDKCWLAWDSIH